MKIAVASGKGGTGKTSVSASLVLARPGTIALDLDVEEPNLGILLGVPEGQVRPVTHPVAVISEEACSRCGLCASSCAYGAIGWFGSGIPLITESLCRGCGLCPRLCPAGAIFEEERAVGEIRLGRAGGAPFVEGRLRVGSVNTVQIIHEAVKAAASFSSDAWVMDCSPGSACPVSAAFRSADLALLVTEPTPFGRSDLEGVLELASDMKIPTALVINKTGTGDTTFADLCARFSAKVLARYPFSRSVAESGARGECPFLTDEQWAETTRSLWRRLEEEFS